MNPDTGAEGVEVGPDFAKTTSVGVEVDTPGAVQQEL